MGNPIQDEKSIFLNAVEIASAEGRDAYLDSACGEDRRLRAEVEALVREHEKPQLVDRAPVAATIDMPPITETVGSIIGPYKIREQIGEGGMGVVYVAEQKKPVRRKVALKIIKPGMDTKQVIARFEAERQVLALMDHPNIAKVLDVGATETGQPYFAMELVRGLPITEYCDKKTLNTRERLELFIQVCRAVQHAHQKGIIHRDLKPTNILVTLIDAAPVPKVIDFGVAKAVNQQLTDHSVYTAHTQMIGTPMYMSPEQADMTNQDVDTRSDVYSLGVLLYELLTGTTPFDKQTLKEAGFDEMRRIIREEEPPRPSARVSTLKAEQLSTLSGQRGLDPRKYSRGLAGELDWIVMRALEKDRARRYESASAFAADIERYLKDEPVEACPPSAAYRLRKFARRNKGRLVAISLITLLLLIGLVAAIGTKLQNDLYRRQLTQDVRQSLAAAQTAIDGDDLSLALERVATAEGRIADGHDALPQLAGNVQRLRTEVEDRREQQLRFQRFQPMARDAQDDILYDKGLKIEGDQLALQALALYGVLQDDRWLDRLKESYLSKQQQGKVRRIAYETLLVLADIRIHSERKKERIDASFLYLRKAEACYQPTRAFYWVRSECHKFLKNKQQAEKDHNRFQQTAATTAFDYYLPGHVAGWRGDIDEPVRCWLRCWPSVSASPR